MTAKLEWCSEAPTSRVSSHWQAQKAAERLLLTGKQLGYRLPELYLRTQSPRLGRMLIFGKEPHSCSKHSSKFLESENEI